MIFYRQFTVYDLNYLARLNSIWRFNLHRIEKNRFPRKCQCVVCGHHFLCQGIDEYLRRQNVCYGCDLRNKVKTAAGNLFQLISAIPQAERDRLEIYPADFRTALIPLPQQSNWGWRTFEEWRREGVILCGISAKSATGQDTLGLRDYSEGTRLLNKFGKYEFAYRQKGGPVWTGRDSHVALWLFGQLTTPKQQRTLQRTGRIYKNSSWWSKKDKPRLFDKCQALSWKANQLFKPGQYSIEFEPQDELKLAKKERADLFRVAKSAGQVVILGSPAKRHANLAKTRADYNEQWQSYWNYGGGDFQPAYLSRQLRKLGSLNIPHETIELRNNMVANLERDFSHTEQTKAA